MNIRNAVCMKLITDAAFSAIEKSAIQDGLLSMEFAGHYESYKFSEDELIKQLDENVTMKESEILDEYDGNIQLKENEEDRPVFLDDLFIDESISSLRQIMDDENAETKETGKADVQNGVERSKKESLMRGSPIDKAANSLLRRTISELERALNDTNKLLSVRDAENSKVRAQLMAMERNYEEEKSRCKTLEEMVEEKNMIINELERRLENEKNEIETLKLWIENNKGDSMLDYVKETICATPEEIDKIREMNIEQEKQILELKMRLRELELEKQREKEKTNNEITKLKTPLPNDQKTKCRSVIQKEQNLQMKLRMKFMRDAFFYFMIDYHAEEQLRAILAILEYEDRRKDIIFESHKMRQQGRKFSVSQVSSRKFTFVQEEHR